MRRYVMLLAFSLLTCSNSWSWITWSPIKDRVKLYWNVSNSAVDQLSTIFMLSYVLLAIPALYFIHKYKLKWSLVVGSVLNTLGCLIRVLGNVLVGSGQLGFILAFLGVTSLLLLTHPNAHTHTHIHRL